MSVLGFVLHPGHPEAKELYEQARRFLDAHGHHAVCFPLAQVRNVDFVVSLGGDGTMLRALGEAVRLGIPALGVNLGRLGYLAEVEPDELNDALLALVEGHYRVEERMIVSASATGHNEVFKGINEVVIERETSGHVIRINVYISGRYFMHYEADGLIVATPTGSTAYNLSARGPIVSPSVEALIMTPLSPHMLFDRPLVLAPEENIEIELAHGPSAAVMVDGQVRARLLPGDRIKITAVPKAVRLARLDHMAFHELIKFKFGLPDSCRVLDD